MTGAVLLLLTAIAITAAPQTPPAASAPAAVRVEFADHDLAIDRPSDWHAFWLRGGGVQVHLVRGANGFPHFTVQSDAGAGLPANVSAAAECQMIEELFSTLARSVSGTTVLSATWSRIHDSMSLRPSVSGTIKVRRLLFLHAGIPHVISWGALADEYEGIAELVERCASSLRHTD